MDSGFGINLEGFLVHGNLSLNPGLIPVVNGDGSLEASGTLYVDKIREYNNENGIDIQNVIFHSQHIEIPFNVPSYSTKGAIIMNGGITILNTTDSTSLSSGGTLTTLGGISIAKTLNIGGEINCNNNKIINVKWPTNPLDAANKEYVDSITFGNNIISNFSSGQVLIGGNTSGSIIGYPSFIYNTSGQLIISTSIDSINLTSGSSLIVYGGVNIYKTLSIGGDLNLNNNYIQNVLTPILPYDGVNKQYVDDLISNITTSNFIGNFTSGQILIGGTGSSLLGYNSFIFNVSSGIYLYNTTDAVGLGTGGNLTLYGGASISKHVYIGGGLDLNSQNITNVATPINDYDAVNKKYVDDMIYNCCTGGGINLFTNFTSGQILIGGSNGSVLGYNSFIFNISSGIYVYNTTDAVGLGTGGNLTLYGGASINKHVFIGQGLDMNISRITNVGTPIEGYDAVNKDYLQALLNNLPRDPYVLKPNNYENSYILNNNVLSPINIPYTTIYGDKTISFIAYIYIENDNSTSLYSIYSYFDGYKWVYYSRFSGPPMNVDFVVTTSSDKIANIGYINRNVVGTTTIQYYIYEDIQISPNLLQYNYTLPKTNTPIDFLNYLYTDLYSVKIHIHVYVNETDASYFIIDLLFKNDKWVMNCDRIGHDIGVNFTMNNNNSIGSIQYTNTNNGTVIARVKEYKILQSYVSYRLLNSTINGLVTPIQLLSDYCQLYIYVEKPEIKQYAFYTVEGLLFNGSWVTNSSFIGDYLHVSFSIDNNGTLTYINEDPVNLTNIKILTVEPKLFVPLQVNQGGTGNTYLQPYSVLIGNGYDPVINTTNFIYQDCALQMKCPSAQIIIYNTTDAAGLGTGGNLTLYGGASIDKSLYVGDALYINNVNITPSAGDINEHVFFANNNVIIPEFITGFVFSTSVVKSFISHISITVMLATQQLDALVILKGINTSSGWKLNKEFIGDNLGIQFYSDMNGNIQYTSIDFPNWIYTKIRFRGETTTI
jgi:hypothetical protein